MPVISVGRRVRPSEDGFELRESIDHYNAHFDAAKCDIGANSAWSWDIQYDGVVPIPRRTTPRRLDFQQRAVGVSCRVPISIDKQRHLSYIRTRARSKTSDHTRHARQW